MSIPERTWIHGVSTSHPDATFRVVTTLMGESSGVALVELVTDDPVSILADVERQSAVTELDLLWKHDEEALLQIETDEPLLLVPVWQAGVPLRTPFEIRDGQTTWETTTSADRLSEFGDRLADLGIGFDIEFVQSVDATESDRLLTDRQLEVLVAAAEQGYYGRPRTATLTEVAATVGISKSTCSDILQRAEGKIIDWFLAEHTGGEY
ncbi:helix-turn-helix domain-containing protein [Halorussus halophilus]|uniref:helix-turn-helix domain-containing protein n=1 Tax=Halorussus halophilus TaxID=2650975 RepID=UPI001CE480E4|nr:helix-turn-helix domain-containing protein [Halorussus halophilus]